MLKLIPEEILEIYQQVARSGFDIYLVGGCVRNLLLKKDVKDWDLTTNAEPSEILKLFPNGFYDNLFGTVGVPAKTVSGQKQVVEITTFRREHEYEDRRHPKAVSWGRTIEEDLSRRDFTINAIAMKLAKGTPPRWRSNDSSDSGGIGVELIDPYGGQKDIEKEIIRSVGDPKKRFKEDALRLIRAIRIAAQFSFIIDTETWEELVNDSPLIAEISKERIQTEILKILESDYPYEGIMLLKNSGLLEYILPELLEGIDISQVRPGRHHKTDVFTHNLLSLKFCPSKDPIVRLAALIHDVGKPRVAKTDEQGLVIFHNHEIAGAKMADSICRNLRFSKKNREKIVNLVRWHMFTVDENLTDAAVRRFIRRIGVENIKDMMDLRVGDRLGGGTQQPESWRLKLFKKRIEKQLMPTPFSINDLAVDGNGVMKILNIKPSKQVGEILQKLFEEVDEDLSKNKKEYLLGRIRELVR